MSYKKAQAAMEFLMTYGWAILVVLVVIGALAYFGILNPQTLLPERCELQQGLYCKDHRIVEDPETDGEDNITLKLENGRGSGIIVTSIRAIGQGDLKDKACGWDVDPDLDCVSTPSDPDCWAGKKGRHIANGASETFKLGGGSTDYDYCGKYTESTDVIEEDKTMLDDLSHAGKQKFALRVVWYADDADTNFEHTMEGQLLAKVEKN